MKNALTGVAAVRLAHQRVKSAEKEREAAVYTAFPIGTRVFYLLAHTRITAKVISHGYGGSLLIRNLATGKERRVDGWDESLTIWSAT